MSRTYPIIEAAVDYFPYRNRVHFTATTNGKHAPGSFHYKGQALDVGAGADQAAKDALAAWLYQFSSHLTELIHSRAGNHSGWYVKNGKRVSHGYYGSTTTAAHVNHVHIAEASVAGANALLAAVKRARPALKQGMSGGYVKIMQTKLHIKADGDFGPGTATALKKFQAAHKLKADAICGSSTWKALG